MPVHCRFIQQWNVALLLTATLIGMCAIRGGAATTPNTAWSFVSRADAHRRLRGIQDQRLFVDAPMPCACLNTSLCAPLKTALPSKEAFAFQVKATNWPVYDWERLTSIVLFDGIDPSMLCMAHARGARVVWGASFGASQLLNDTARNLFVNETVARVVNSYSDGVNLDFEDPVVFNSPEYHALTSLTETLSVHLKAAVPTASMSFDVAWSAHDIDGRSYNYSALAAACDFLVIMDYDTRSQVFSGPPCFAGPNSPGVTVTEGIRSFLDIPSILPEKLVLGEPWYGYVYSCENATDVTTGHCQIASVPFRGVACSDAAGTQWPLAQINSFLSDPTTQRYTPIVVNTSMTNGGSFVTVNVNNTLMGSGRGQPSTWQPKEPVVPLSVLYWDNAETLREKYMAAKSWQLRGVSMWNVDSLSEDVHDPESAKVWRALDAFFL